MSNYITLFKNFSYLSLIQIFNFISPIIVLPYLISVLGADIYGEIIFAQTILNYLLIIVVFGFNLSAVKQISLNRNNPNVVNEIFSNISYIKLLLLILALLILMIITFFINTEFVNHELLFLTSWIILYDIFFPTWYFQGIEKMGYITLLTLISKSIFFISVFIFIKNSNDFLLYPLIQLCGTIVTGVFSYYIIFINHKIRLTLPSFNKISYYFNDSINIFLSNIFQTIFINTNKIVIGSYLGMSQVTFYDLAEKVYSLAKIPQSIAGQVIFPKISKDKDLKFVFKFLKYLLLFNLFTIIVCLIFSNKISFYFLGDEIQAAIIAINLISLSLPFSSIHNVLGVQILISFGFSKIYTKVIFKSLFVYLLLIMLLINFEKINLINLIVSIILTEIYISISLYNEYKKRF
jgi:O-antigen/teichoic acid export membrane protein